MGTQTLHKVFKLVAALAAGLFAFPLLASATACDRACLLKHAERFNSAMLRKSPLDVELSRGAQVRENAEPVALANSKWAAVQRILSKGVFADPVSGNVIEHVVGQTAEGKTVYIGTRLKIAGDKVSEVEINFDDSDRVNLQNLDPYDPIFNTIVPPEERSTRQQLEHIIASYFEGLTTHQPVKAEYDNRCDRYHSGNRVTHNSRNGIEESGEVGCYESNLGAKPWGPVTEVRVSLIDPERGIVIAYAVLHYGTSSRRMQINEVFKILGGRIRMIDNIGLMKEGLTTSGFAR